MKASIVESVIGVLGFNGKNKLVERILFPKNAEAIASILRRIQGGEATSEVLELVERLRKRGYNVFVFESEALSKSVHEKLGADVEVEKPSAAGEALRKKLGKIAVEVGFADKPDRVRTLIHDVSVALTRGGVKKAAEKRDLLIIQAIQALDDVDKTLNLFSSRLREWYGLHFPELNRLMEKHEMYLRLVADLGDRSAFTLENLEKEGVPADKIKIVAEASKSSMGASVAEEDLEKIREMCRNMLELYKIRDSLETYIDNTMKTVTPNIHSLVGASLGARLIALAGGLENLAKRPASTIQVLGAEKALFRALRTGAKPPKHGVIFQHQDIHSAERWQRGKIARALAGKLAIAARLDAFSGEYLGDALKIDFEKRVAEIQEKHKQPLSPPRKGGTTVRKS